MKKYAVTFTEWNTVEGIEKVDYVYATSAVNAKVDYSADHDVKVIDVEEVEDFRSEKRRTK